MSIKCLSGGILAQCRCECCPPRGPVVGVCPGDKLQNLQNVKERTLSLVSPLLSSPLFVLSLFSKFSRCTCLPTSVSHSLASRMPSLAYTYIHKTAAHIHTALYILLAFLARAVRRVE